MSERKTHVKPRAGWLENWIDLSNGTKLHLVTLEQPAPEVIEQVREAGEALLTAFGGDIEIDLRIGGIKKPKQDLTAIEARQNRIWQLHREGKSNAEIARMYQVDPTSIGVTLQRHRTRLGLPRTTQKGRRKHPEAETKPKKPAQPRNVVTDAVETLIDRLNEIQSGRKDKAYRDERNRIIWELREHGFTNKRIAELAGLKTCSVDYLMTSSQRKKDQSK